MAGRNLPQARVFSNVPEITMIYAKVTFVADIGAAASGGTKLGTFNFGGGYFHATDTSAITRTAEGELKFVFRDKYKRMIWCNATGDQEDMRTHFKGEDVDGATPYVELRFETASTGADIDPDGAVFYFAFAVQNSGLNY